MADFLDIASDLLHSGAVPKKQAEFKECSTQ